MVSSVVNQVKNTATSYIGGITKTISNTGLLSLASIFFANKKEKLNWYFSAPTNGPMLTVVDVHGDVRQVPKYTESVLPSAVFIDMSLDYGGQVVGTPIEEGSFSVYNKTTQPLAIEATLGFDENKGASIWKANKTITLSEVIDKLVRLKTSPIIFNIVTPYYEYQSMTLESFSYGYSMDHGLGVLFVRARFKNIPEVKVVTLKPTDVKKADCADVQKVGAKTVKESSVAADAQKKGGLLGKIVGKVGEVAQSWASCFVKWSTKVTEV